MDKPLALLNRDLTVRLQRPGYDLSGIQLHDTGQIDKSTTGPYVDDIRTPCGVRASRMEIPV